MSIDVSEVNFSLVSCGRLRQAMFILVEKINFVSGVRQRHRTTCALQTAAQHCQSHCLNHSFAAHLAALANAIWRKGKGLASAQLRDWLQSASPSNKIRPRLDPLRVGFAVRPKRCPGPDPA